MLTNLLLPEPHQLRLDTLTMTTERITLDVTPSQAASSCPRCRGESTRVHSRYQRTVADFAWAHIPVVLQLHVRRFFCPSSTCPRVTFSEPLPTVVAPFARRTLRLATEQRQLGLDAGGEAGARTAQRQGMPVSPDTLLRLVRRDPPTTHSTPRHLGVDDFALRKGQIYGTILVDLDQHQPIDLLPERSAAILERWLKDHPGVEVITRDRATEYADGATRGAPNAVQVADRFHLLQNVRELLQRLMERHQAALQAATKVDTAPADAAPVVADDAGAAMTDSPTDQLAEANASSDTVSMPPPHLPKAVQQSQGRRDRRLTSYTTVRALHRQGLSIRAIAEQLHLSRKTVRRFVSADQFPERATRRSAPSKLDPFLPYLQQQMAAGQDNAMQLWRELREQHGYTGSRALVSRWVARHRHLCPVSDPAAPQPRRRGRPPAPAGALASPPQRRCSARQAAWLLVRRPDELEDADRRIVERLCQHSAAIDTAYHLAQDFIQIVRERQATALDGWLDRARASDIPEIDSFVAGLQRDHAAVLAALELSWSNGQVEGQVNRLKLIKRSMYGRANFDLLRQRVLAA
jgi:transposase